MNIHSTPFSSDPVPDYFRNVRKEIEPLLPVQIRKVLEIGCGAGGTMAWLRTIRSIEYAAGVEISPDAAALARGAFDEVITADITKSAIDFGQAKFDVVLALDVLEHLPDPWQVLRFLNGMMEPGGTLIASIPNVAHYSVAFPLLFKGRWNYTEDGLLDRTHLRFFTRETVGRMFEETGFSVERIATNTRFPRIFSPLGLTGRRWTWYSEKLFRTVFGSSHRFFDWQFLVVARPKT